ncbi:MAG: hypothetical protein V4558_15550 [Gemmatimonadota bacterium]
MVSPLARALFAGVLLFTGLVVSASAQAARSLHVRLEWRVDGDSADLSAVSAVTVGKDGTVAVALPQDHEVLILTPQGKEAGRFGRTGAGPGEFRQILWLGWRSDSIWVFDGVLKRAALFDPARKFVRTFRIPVSVDTRHSAGPPQASGISPFRLLSGDSMVALGIASGAEPDSYHGVLFVTNVDGTAFKLLADFPPYDCYVDIRGRKTSVPFCSNARVAYSPDGGLVAVAEVDKADQARSSASFTLRVLGPRGDTLSTRRHRMATELLPAKLFEAAVSKLTDPSRVPPDIASEIRGRLSKPTFYPALSSLFIGRDGTIWAGRTGGEGISWLVIDSGGREIGTLTLSKALRVVAVAQGRMWAVETSDSGVESIVQFRVGPR